MICRRKLLEGFQVSYVPGWDCHGLPIELKALPNESSISNPIEIRQKAKRFAENVIEEHKNCFKNWGIVGDWDNPYLTFQPNYVKNQIQAFETLLEKGLLFRDKMPVYWSPTALTALAEAELQYNEEHLSKSVYVKFKLKNIPQSIKNYENIYAMIWTTTPWTLPSNQAIAYSSQMTYVLVTFDKFSDHFLVSKDLIQDLEKTFETKINVKQEMNGSDLQTITYTNPISLESDEVLPFLDSNHVTATKGTGLVHISPNHGLDDYKLVVKNNIPLKDCIVDERGRYVIPSNPVLNDKFVLNEGNEMVMKLLADSLLLKRDLIHSYPYDWRFNEPVIVRSSPQWFLNIENIRNDCITAVESVTFYPNTYKEYLINQLKVRPNWCISRQRSWGVPIPVFYRKDDKQMKNPLISRTILEQIIKQFETKGCDIWWLSTIDQLVPNQLFQSEFNLSSNDLIKGTDIFDIWFDSGISWKTALNEPNIADMYLEGCDQLRGWFQSSLILSVALRNCSPFKSVKVHGFALDSEGKKMSKSIGNVIDPNAIIEDNRNAKTNCGSDGFRWWVAKYASDHKDQRVVSEHFDETLVNINRIRLTLRFMIGVLNDFNVSKDICNYSEMNILDKYVLHLLHNYSKQMNSGYSDFDFSYIIEKSLQFIISQVSGFYFSRIRHRLYCDSKTSLRRTSCQTVILYLYNTILLQLAPVLPHIMIEANKHLPIDKNLIHDNEEWNQLNIEEDMKLIISMTDLINKELYGKHLIEYDCHIKTCDSDCLKNLSVCL